MSRAHWIVGWVGALLMLARLAPTLAAQGPTLAIQAPAEGATVSAPVTLSWSVQGVTIKPAGDATSREEGHFHLFVDKEPALAEGVAIPAGDPQIIHTAATQAELSELGPGSHSVTVVLGYSDHTPWWPAVTDRVTFTVGEPPATLPSTGALHPAVAPWLMAGLALLGIATLLRRTRRA